MKFDVEAAGGVVVRRTAKGHLKVLLVHRPNHRDWTFPKGKLDPSETHRKAALREVREETGLQCEIVGRIPSAKYVLPSGRSKRVKYWVMSRKRGRFAPNSEVDRVQWLVPDKARHRLTYKRDQRILDAALGLVAEVGI